MPEEKPDPYKVLGIQKEGASPEDIDRAYRKRAKETHPDFHPDDKEAAQRFKEVQSAWEGLKNPQNNDRTNPTPKSADTTSGGPGPAPQKNPAPNKSSDDRSNWYKAGRAAGKMGRDAWEGAKYNAPRVGKKAWGEAKAFGQHLREGAKTGAKAYGRRGRIIRGLAKKGSGQKSKEGDNKSFAGIGPGSKGGDASQVAKKTEQRTLSAMMAVPEAAIMLPIAILLDAAGLIVFVLDFIGVGLGLSFILDIAGLCSIGFWVLTRGFFRGIIKKMVSYATSTLKSVGSGAKGQTQMPIQPKSGVEAGMQSGMGLGKKAAKAGLKVGASVAWFLVTLIIELIPFLGDIIPSWTILVIRELIQGEITQ